MFFFGGDVIHMHLIVTIEDNKKYSEHAMLHAMLA